MSDDRLQLHEEISLSIRREEERVRLRTRVIGSEDDSFSTGLTDVPVASMKLIRPGDEVHGTVTRRDALYHFKTTIIEIVQNVPQPSVVFHQPVSIWREQRRQFFRADQKLPVSVLLEYYDSKRHIHNSALDGDIINISAGGLLITVTITEDATLEEGTHALVAFTHGTHCFRDLPGRIIRVKESHDRQTFAMIFIDPDQDTQNKITRLNIDYERRHLKGE